MGARKRRLEWTLERPGTAIKEDEDVNKQTLHRLLVDNGSTDIESLLNALENPELLYRIGVSDNDAETVGVLHSELLNLREGNDNGPNDYNQ